MENKRDRLNRSRHSAFKKRCDVLRREKGVTMEKMALDLGMVAKTKDGVEKGQQARLSQLENDPDGMPLWLIIKYAEYFKEKEHERFIFIYEALMPSEDSKDSKKIIIDVNSLKGISLKAFITLVAGGLSFNRYYPGGIINYRSLCLEKKIEELSQIWTEGPGPSDIPLPTDKDG